MMEKFTAEALAYPVLVSENAFQIG